ncbi:DUF4411 family protein [Methylomonas koyamae]|uniref:DUF4411 family protein n=1 Tax=Methylomonas koyamae TaxID=702114 RepID=UPI000BC33825|nr:DUF4411 family protein [Methylomonas koyamae]ATG89123.1 hypothetical protein MKLM6_0851 [Methylomonas koyamae]
MSLIYPYLLDTNIFIQAKNLHYQFGFCTAFWDWIIEANQAGLVGSIAKVHKELNTYKKKNDPIQTWMQSLPDGFFIDEMTHADIRGHYASIMKWIADDKHYLPAAKKEFASHDEADAFLIAAAVAHQCKIVTHEIRKPAQLSKVQLPDAADKFSVETISVYDLLSRHATGNFNFTL